MREPSNAVDQYTVAVLKDNTIVGHLLKTSSCIYLLFLRKGGVIGSRVAGRGSIQTYIPQGIKFADKIFRHLRFWGKYTVGEHFPPAKITCYTVYCDILLQLHVGTLRMHAGQLSQ